MLFSYSRVVTHGMNALTFFLWAWSCCYPCNFLVSASRGSSLLQLPLATHEQPTCVVTIECFEGNNPDCCGLAGYLLGTIQRIKACLDVGARPFVHWDARLHTVCGSGSTNCWNNFFQPLVPIEGLSGRKSFCVDRGDIDDDEVQGSHAQEIAGNSNMRESLGHVLNNHVVLNSAIGSRVKSFAAEHFAGRHMLGIQVRATDYKLEFGEDLIPAHVWIDAARKVFARMESPKGIFVAADNQYIIDEYKKEFPEDLVVALDAHRAPDYAAHNWYSCGDRSYDSANLRASESADTCKQEIGEEVLSDIWLLSSCDELVFWEGAVVKMALVLNPDLKATPVKYVNAGITNLTKAYWTKASSLLKSKTPCDDGGHCENTLALYGMTEEI